MTRGFSGSARSVAFSASTIRCRAGVAENTAYEMVRRLISTMRWRLVLAGSRRIIAMQIHSVGIDLGKNKNRSELLQGTLDMLVLQT
jgi:hypothetical protein